MVMQSNHHDKVRVVIECTPRERACIKMLAARKHMTISNYFLSMAREEMANKPNKATIEAMKELDDGGGHSFGSMKDFWGKMGINPDD